MRRSMLAIAVTAAFWQAGCPGAAKAEAPVPAPQPVTLAIPKLDYVDTSGEANDQTAAHRERLEAFASALQRDLAESGKYRIVPISCGAEPCTARTDPFELQKAAQAAGVRLLVVGGIHKVSTLVQWAKLQIADESEGQIVFDRSLTFRGDTDQAWQKAEGFAARQILDASPGAVPAAAAAARVTIAVFDFELEDYSAGAGLIPVGADDIEQLQRATEEARRLIASAGLWRGRCQRRGGRGCQSAYTARLRRLRNRHSWQGRCRLVASGNCDADQPYGLRGDLQAARCTHRRAYRRRTDGPPHGSELLLEPRRGLADKEPPFGETKPTVDTGQFADRQQRG